MSELFISEIFGPTLQGEGNMIGVQTVFVRSGGCDFRCSWCDTMYAVDPKYKSTWRKMTSQAVFETIQTLSSSTPLWVTLSGGNPALQDFAELIRIGHKKGYRFCIETQGSVAQDWFNLLDHLTLSPKPPSSKMQFDKKKFDTCLSYVDPINTSFKIVIADETDLMWAYDLAQLYPQYSFYLQPCNPLHEAISWNRQAASDATITLHQWVTRLKWHQVRILPQLHYLLWGDERGK